MRKWNEADVAALQLGLAIVLCVLGFTLLFAHIVS